MKVQLRQCLVAQRAAVDRQLDAGDVLRLVRRQVHHTGGDVGRLTEARDHDVLLERGAVHRVGEDCRHPGGAGEVGIGVYGNELRLHADNPGAAVSFGTQDNAGAFTQAGRFQISGAYGLYVNGSIWANGNTYASDERFKQNITPIQSPLQKLLQIDGVEYEMRTTAFPQNNFQPGRQMGLLAQNVEKIIPEAVSEKDGYKGVDYARLVPLLIEAIKEQDKKMEAQQKQIDEQRMVIEQLLKK